MKLYVVTRTDLPIGAQAAQAAHAAIEAARADTAHVRAWHSQSNTIVLLVADSHAKLERLAAAADVRGCEMHVFREPDLGDQLTAIALLGDRAERVCAGLRLLGGDLGPVAQRQSGRF